jgi:hypothetical protein
MSIYTVVIKLNFPFIFISLVRKAIKTALYQIFNLSAVDEFK